MLWNYVSSLQQGCRIQMIQRLRWTQDSWYWLDSLGLSVLPSIIFIFRCHAERHLSHDTIRPRQNGRHFVDDILQCSFFFCENILILLRFHLNLFPRVQLTIKQHWFGLWLGTGQATSHYLSQCYPRSLSPYGGTRPEWVNILKPGQNSKYCADNIFKHIFLKEIVKLWIKS